MDRRVSSKLVCRIILYRCLDGFNESDSNISRLVVALAEHKGRRDPGFSRYLQLVPARNLPDRCPGHTSIYNTHLDGLDGIAVLNVNDVSGLSTDVQLHGCVCVPGKDNENWLHIISIYKDI